MRQGTGDRALPKFRPFLVLWRNSKFSKDNWVLLLKDTQGVDNLSIDCFPDYEESWAEE
jgi:hypothetical protein